VALLISSRDSANAGAKCPRAYHRPPTQWACTRSTKSTSGGASPMLTPTELPPSSNASSSPARTPPRSPPEPLPNPTRHVSQVASRKPTRAPPDAQPGRDYDPPGNPRATSRREARNVTTAGQDKGVDPRCLETSDSGDQIVDPRITHVVPWASQRRDSLAQTVDPSRMANREIPIFTGCRSRTGSDGFWARREVKGCHRTRFDVDRSRQPGACAFAEREAR